MLALAGTDFMTAVTDAITAVLGWIGTFIGSLLGTGTDTSLAPLLPLFAIGVAISAILLGDFFSLRVKRVNSVDLPFGKIPSQA